MNPTPPRPSDHGVGASRWLWIVGVAGLVWAARLHEIQLHAGDTPFLDQWDVEGRQILVPWLQGKISWTAFFASHNEHVPLWTRLIVWCEAVVLGRWDPLVQVTINAALQGAFAGMVADWLRRTLVLGSALGLTLLVVVLSALPFGWENSTWGFQVLTPLALIFVFLYVLGSFTRPFGSTGWWLTQAAGAAAVFTYGSMWAAPAAVFLTAWWTAAPHRRSWVAAALLTVGGAAVLLAARARQDPAATLALTAHTPQEFVAAFLYQLGWPAAWPGACAVLVLPGFLLALRLRSQSRAENIDRVIVALAIWGAAQATAFGYARGGNYIGFVSRYGDLLALGVVAHGVALWRFWQVVRSWRRAVVATFALLWLAVLGQGLAQISLHGHAEYFHERSAALASLRHEAVQHYLASHDIQSLSSEDVRKNLYPNPELVAQVLDQPGLSALLPASLRPSPAPTRGDIFSNAAALLRPCWSDLAGSSALIFILACGLTRRHPIVAVPPSKVSISVDRWQGPILGALAVGSAALVFLWPKPLEFSPEKRWEALLAPKGTVAVTFHFTGASTYSDDRLTGGADLWPEDFRNRFSGTRLDGNGFVGTAESSPFPLTSPWLVIPFAGFPASPGNSLHLRIEDALGHGLQEVAYSGPNTTDIDFWAVDIRGFTGRSGRILLVDGRTDAEGWVAAAPPQPATGPERAAMFRRDRASEPTRFGQQALGVIALASLLLCIGTALTSRRRRP